MSEMTIKTENVQQYYIGRVKDREFITDVYFGDWVVRVDDTMLCISDENDEDDLEYPPHHGKFSSLEAAVKAGQAYIEKHGGTLA